MSGFVVAIPGGGGGCPVERSVFIKVKSDDGCVVFEIADKHAEKVGMSDADPKSAGHNKHGYLQLYVKVLLCGKCLQMTN